jgi:hypothetical protein
MILGGKEGERSEVAQARAAYLKDGDAKVGGLPHSMLPAVALIGVFHPIFASPTLPDGMGPCPPSPAFYPSQTAFRLMPRWANNERAILEVLSKREGPEALGLALMALPMSM